ncbi:MAG: hypothetical protein WBP29_05805 [Candidatus Zixiibacteriota bacterium]
MKPTPLIDANPVHVASVSAIITALYDSISFKRGESADWKKMRSLFIPDGRLLIPKRDTTDSTSLSVEQFVERGKIVFQNDTFRGKGFREVETTRREEAFGFIRHIFSAYEAILTDKEDALIGRGINSIQLLWESDRWWIVSMVWNDERPDNPMPDWANQ